MHPVDVVVVGQIARDLVLLVEELPAPGTGAAVQQRREMLELVVLGAGEAGNAVIWDGGATVLPLLDVDVIDSTGAGDAFTAGLVAGLLRGSQPQEAGRLATAAAALSVGELGGRPHLTQLSSARGLDAR